MIFFDRTDAGKQLAAAMLKYRDSDGVIMAIPRGGLPIGFELSKELNLPLDILLSKKIGYPGQSEFAIGAVTMDNYFVDELYRQNEEYIKSEVSELRKQLKDKYRMYKGHQPAEDIRNKTVIITDDGIATGRTIMVNIQLLREKGAKKIVIAVPVAPSDSIAKLEKIADEVICLTTPEDFMGVGQFYSDFSQISDEQAISILEKARGRNAA